MASNESGDLAVQVAELRSDVRHAQKDITDIKTDVRDIRTELREIKESLGGMKIWALSLYIALAGTLLYVVARSAKWL